MNRRFHTDSLWATRAAFHLWMMVAMLQLPKSAFAQEAIRNAVAGEAAADSQKLDLESMPYTVKSGDFKLLVASSLEADWNNNVNVANTNQLQDFILEPSVQLNASYPITQVNLLQLNVGFGYDKYIDHDIYSSWQVTSGSQLSFNTSIKDILINLHDRFGYSQDAGSQAVVVGTGDFGTGNNVAGVSITWNPDKLNMSLGYDHQNVISSAAQFQSQDSSSELFDGRAGWRFEPTVTAGIEATYSAMSYDQAILNNNASYTIGAYGEWDAGSYFTVRPRAGYTVSQFQQTSVSAETFGFTLSGVPVVMLTGKPLRTSDSDSWYADLTLTHDITRFLSYSLSAGHEIQAGIQSDAVEDSYLRLSSTWKFIRNMNLNGSFSYEHGQQGVGNIAGNLTENFDWYTGSVGIDRQITTKLTMGLNSRVTLRSSSSASLGYTQAMVGMHVAYAFE